MRHTIGLAAAMLASAALAGAGQAEPMTPRRAAAIDAAVRAGMERVHAKGLSIAVIERGKVVLTRRYGVRNAAGAPVAADTILYGASLTKAVFAYTVLRLVDEGKVDLDRPLSMMLPKPLPAYGNLAAYGNWGDLAADDRWKRITPRIALTHTTGFANYGFLEPDRKLRIHFDPGTRYAYSGEGIILLQFAIEQALGTDFQAEAQRLTFGPLGMRDSSLKWRKDFKGRTADGWQADGTAVEHDERSRVRASGSMDTTLDDVARFAAAIVSGTNLSARAHAELLRPQLPITTRSQFPTLQPELPADQRWRGVSAGLGVVTFSGPQGAGFYKGGHDEQTANTMVCLRAGRRCVVILGNDVRDEALFPELVRTALGETGMPWRWEYPDQFAPR